MRRRWCWCCCSCARAAVAQGDRRRRSRDGGRARGDGAGAAVSRHRRQRLGAGQQLARAVVDGAAAAAGRAQHRGDGQPAQRRSTRRAPTRAMAQIGAAIDAAQRRAELQYERAIAEAKRTGRSQDVDGVSLSDEGVAGARIDAEATSPSTSTSTSRPIVCDRVVRGPGAVADRRHCRGGGGHHGAVEYVSRARSAERSEETVLHRPRPWSIFGALGAPEVRERSETRVRGDGRGRPARARRRAHLAIRLARQRDPDRRHPEQSRLEPGAGTSEVGPPSYLSDPSQTGRLNEAANRRPRWQYVQNLSTGISRARSTWSFPRCSPARSWWSACSSSSG